MPATSSLQSVLKQIDRALRLYEEAQATSRYDDISDLPDTKRREVELILETTIQRLAPEGSAYRKVPAGNAPSLVASLKALRRDYEDGYLVRIQGLVRAEVFADFTDMAEHLLDESYKDPAAVLIGGVLEEHLRSLCIANGISIVSGGKPKKADTMNADLAKDGTYGKLDQKSVTAWLDLRNKSAHGQYSEYRSEQVRNMLAGVREFAARTGAA
jgi:hypothetical protein